MFDLAAPTRPFIGLEDALSNPGVRLLLAAVAGAFVLACIAIALASKHTSPSLRAELTRRTVSWGVMAPMVILPVLMGRLPLALMVTVMGLLCHREFARATGLFREKTLSALVLVSIVLFNFSALDHWFGLFMALAPLSIVMIAAVAILKDRPDGYIQRVGLAVMGALLFGGCLSHLGWFANEPGYRAPLLLLFFAVGLNDVFAFCVGKLFGGPKLAPRTSPNKTIAGAIGAVILTTLTTFALGGACFQSQLGSGTHLLVMGAMVSLFGILGDLTISSMKRDVGIKDMGSIIPGHGGLLDRCNSLLLSAPALFHYVSYFHGIGEGQPVRVITGGW